MSVFDHPEFDDHESVHFFSDSSTGLKAIIAVHSTALGPGAGGCRRWTYARSEDALTDVLRLSRGMSYKNAVAGLPLGGGKAVILADDENAPKSPALFRAYGRAIDSLGGRYITAEDVGIAVEDMHAVQEVTRFVTGVSKDGRGGDPSPWTAWGIFNGIEAAVRRQHGRDSVSGLTVAVQGVGHVGFHLCRYLHESGANLIVADMNKKNLTNAVEAFGARVVPVEDILSTECDVLAPCALGNVLNKDSIPHIRAGVIAGAANNQLGTDEDGDLLLERGILYAPDYVINGGGIIAVGREFMGDAEPEALKHEIAAIGQRLDRLFDASASRGIATNRLADEMARSIIHGTPPENDRLSA